ncbi:hypothetical protein [Paenibacillus piscarius]|uniref:hypothetical protein n=1 Tax=Paenibacillus piscarius TaxID=1089681 RepID=UPI001EE851B1|nr:hypothetical protein [Paenibacillus piscarius]
MSLNKRLAALLVSLAFLSGCDGNSESPNTAKIDEEYNLIITNNSPLFLKSVVVTVEEKDETHINSFIDSNISVGEIAKFKMENGNHNFKITLNPKKNYSVSKEVSEKFEADKIIAYQVKIVNNEVAIIKKSEKD